MKKIIALLVIPFIACNPSDDGANQQPEMYFPPVGSEVWATSSIDELGWNESAVTPLLQYLDEKNTKSFIVLVDGKIVIEHYFDGHLATTPWYWASAGKTLTATLVGIAEQEGFFDIDDKVSDYLGEGWTSAPLEKENLITIRHLLTMTSGLDDTLGDDVSPANLQYVADAGSRWAYHNVYVQLQKITEQAVGRPWSEYFDEKLRTRIGMSGAWIDTGNDLSVYWSNSRSMARFGLLMLNKGAWNGDSIINESYFNAATSTSQNINESYGYLWWLNGKDSYHLPQTQFEFSGSIIPAAPSDMYMALGKNDQKIYVVPSKNMIVIRMGDAADGQNLALSGFDNTLWEKINALYN